MNKRRRIEDDTTSSTSGTSRDTAIDLTTSPVHPRHRHRNPPAFSQRQHPLTHSSYPRPSMATTNGPSRHTGAESPSAPPWQPDASVDECPVCHTTFGLWIRKHHCRKCGRVVCAACSPHRITIPRQYIVTPYDSSHHSELGGGEVVRVCNPCVPDPWVPPDSPHPAAASPTTPASAIVDIPHPPVQARYRSGLPPPHRHRSHTFQAMPGPRSSSNTTSRIIPSSSMAPISSSAYMASRHRHHDNMRPPGASSSAPSAPPMQPPPPQRQRREIAEEDECPVCGTELPPGESSRENHIQACVISRFSTSSGSPTAPHMPIAPPGGETPSNPLPLPLPPYRPRGMAVFHATEKDCIAEEDGQLPECQICLEEFEAGEELGRMECLCKFHRKCIRAWWDTKGTGSCPTHQLHD